jgi:hypothetical protein
MLTKVKNLLFSVMIQAILTLCLAVTFLAPDYLSKMFISYNKVIFSQDFFYIIIIFSLFLTLTARRVIAAVLIIFGIFEIIQFLHLFYFGSFITPGKIGMIFVEYKNIASVAVNSIGIFFYVPFLVIIPYYSVYYLFQKFESARFKSKFMVIPIIVILSFLPYKVLTTKNFSTFNPNSKSHSLKNSLYAFSGYFFKVIPDNIKQTATPNKRNKPYMN